MQIPFSQQNGCTALTYVSVRVYICTKVFLLDKEDSYVSFQKAEVSQELVEEKRDVNEMSCNAFDLICNAPVLQNAEENNTVSLET